MKYKVSNYLFNTQDGKAFRIDSVYDSFEDVADKLIRDMNSLWKGVVPFPFRFEIFEVDDDKVGMSIYEDDKLVAHNDDVIAGMMERYGYEMTKVIPDQKKAIEQKNDENIREMANLLKKVSK
jgi:hypothetical protein